MYQKFTKFLLLLAVILFCNRAFSQIGIGTNTPDAKSILDIQSTTKGVLLPRLSAAQQATLAASLGAGETGMLVTDATTGKLLGWSGKIWTDPTNLSADAPLTVSSTNQISFNPGTTAGDLITWDGNNWVNMQPATVHFNLPIDNRQPYLVVNYCIALTGIFPSRNDPFLSQIQIFPYNFAPLGWAFCDGQILPISQNTAVFSLLGTTYGGNGTTNFALPNLQSRVPLSFSQGPGLSPYNLGDQGGAETNTISR